MLRWLSKLWRNPIRTGASQVDLSEYSVHPPNLAFLTDVSPGRWVEEGLSQCFATMGSLVPGGYAAYARLLYPAGDESNRPVRWSTVAEWSGRIYHPLMAFEGISSPVPGHGAGSPPWDEDPNHGSMDEEEATELASLLAHFTSTPEECYFGVWEGYGQYSGGAAMLTSDGRGRRLDTPHEIRRAQRVKGVGRNYLLYRGRLEDIVAFHANFLSEPPNIWWPADRAWFVATDIDLDATYIGASRECIDALLAHAVLEAVVASREASVAMTADVINLGDESGR